MSIEDALKVLREPPEEVSKYLERTGQRIESISSPCGMPLVHRDEDGVMVNSETGKPLAKPAPVEPDADGDFQRVEYPEQVLINFLDSIKGAKSVAEAYRKIFKLSSFDSEAKEQIKHEIKLLIVKWRTVESTLDRKPALTLAQDGRSEDAVDDPTPARDKAAA